MEDLPRPIAILFSIITLFVGILWYFAANGQIPLDPNVLEPILTIIDKVFYLSVLITIGTAAYPKREVEGQIHETPEQTIRRQLIETVKNNWIDGVLKDALRDTVIQIDIEGKPEKAGDSTLHQDYELPIDLVLWNGNIKDDVTYTPKVLLKTFEQVGKKLLILGAPGSGKTVLMLQLAERLLHEARESQHAIPVVFNLSSWAEKREPLTKWLTERLKLDYDASEKFATELINGDNLIYLLDGFDEVAEDYRGACLEELNQFISPTRQLVICSRIQEYEALSQPLNTQYAIEVQPLSEQAFKTLINERIPYPETTQKILKTLEADSAVWEEVNKPLFINILIQTYADGRPFAAQNIEGTEIEKIQQLIIEPYIERQLQNKASSTIDNALIPRYLAWIGANLRQREQTIFYIEMLQPEWLFQKSAINRFRWIFGLIVVLVVGLIGGLIFGLIVGLSVGLSVVLVVGLSGIDLEKRTRFNPKAIYTEMREAFKLMLIGGLIVGLIGGLSVGLIFGLIVGLSVGLGVGLSDGLVGGLMDTSQLTQRNQFNQGFRETLIVGLIVGLSVVLGVGLGVGLSDGLIVGLIVGLSGGLSGILKHIVLRWMLKRRMLVPRRIDYLLLHVIERRIMRRVGGSAIFVHRYVLEYFADYWDRHYASEFVDE